MPAKASTVSSTLPSGEIRNVDARCRANVGEVGNAEQSNIIRGKAGRNRWKGHRPTVRGVAMSPVDHPHGGGSVGDLRVVVTRLTPTVSLRVVPAVPTKKATSHVHRRRTGKKRAVETCLVVWRAGPFVDQHLYLKVAAQTRRAIKNVIRLVASLDDYPRHARSHIAVYDLQARAGVHHHHRADGWPPSSAPTRTLLSFRSHVKDDRKGASLIVHR